MSQSARVLPIRRVVPGVVDPLVKVDPRPEHIGALSAKQVLLVITDHMPAAIAALEAEERVLLAKLHDVRQYLARARNVFSESQ